MLNIIRCIPAAFSMYSRIPMPGFEPKEDDMKRCIMFLPLPGIVIGIVMFCMIRVLGYLPAPVSVRAMILATVPLIVTGGFHIDGFMDTVDARSSLKTREEKLSILADPHVGAFAVTRFAILGIFAVSALTVIINMDGTAQRPVFVIACGVFVISRSLAALTSIYMKRAKNDGMLANETEDAGACAITILMIELIVPAAFMAYLNPVHTLASVLAFIIFTLYYMHMTKKEFGGVTGDTAGYYVTVGEVFALTVIAATTFLPIG